MKRRLAIIRAGLVPVTLLVSVPALFLYASLSIPSKGFLAPSTALRFTHTLAFASIIHVDSNGGPRAWRIIRDSVSEAAVSQTSLQLGSQTYTVPLPPYTIRKSCDRLIAGLPREPVGPGPRIPPSCQAGAEYPTERPNFITTASWAQVDRYVQQTLPEAGWIFEDQYGSTHIFRRGDVQFTMDLGSYLTVHIRDFSLDIMPAPTTD